MSSADRPPATTAITLRAMATDFEELLGHDASNLLTHQCKGVTADELTLPGPDYIDRVFLGTDRPIPVVRNLATSTTTVAGRHRLPVDPPRRPGHRASAARQLRQEPRLLRSGQPRRAGHRRRTASAIATTLGGLGHRGPPLRPQDPVHRQAQPQRASSTTRTRTTRSCSASVRQAADLGAVGVGATIYFGSEQSDRQIQEVRTAFAEAHELGLFTVLWCYLRNDAFKTKEADYHLVGRPHRPGQPHGRHHRGRHHQAEAAREQRRLQRPASSARPTRSSTSSSPPTTPSTSPAGRSSTATSAGSGLINSGGESKGADDLAQAVRTAVINKRAGGTGPDRRPQGLPAPHGRRRRAPPRRPGRLPRQIGHRRLTSRRRPDGRPGPPAPAGTMLGAEAALVDSGLIRGSTCPSGSTGGAETEDCVHRDTPSRRQSSTGSSSASPVTPVTGCS